MSQYTCWNCEYEFEEEPTETWETCPNCDEIQVNSAGKFWKDKCLAAREVAEYLCDWINNEHPEFPSRMVIDWNKKDD